MTKKRYNWKARQIVSTEIDNRETKKIAVDLNIDGNYDQSNELVLPSKKRKTKIKTEKVGTTRILSKKQRKRLEKIVEKKKKKENRAELLASLQQCRATEEELSQLTSLASIQTKGLKRHFQEETSFGKKAKRSNLEEGTAPAKINILSGAKRRKLLVVGEAPEESIRDPNVVGFESSGSDEGEEEDEEEEDEDEGTGDDQENVKIDEEKANETQLDNQCTEQEIECITADTQPAIVVEDDAKKVVSADEKPRHEPLPRKPAVYVDVIRSEEIQQARMKLPILAEEQSIMETINENHIVVIAGETGSGKTTQVPQFLYEAGYALKKQIAVTEPRRVAAVSMSQRVAEEMNLSHREVSYLIRFEGNATEHTRIKFMTDGVLLKELQSDFLLSKYSVVILDEAHERSVYTDILIGLLSRIVPLRLKKGDPLKLIIMSATLRLADFIANERLFKIPPRVINVESRQFPVTVHFNKRTADNYLKEALSKTRKIHTKLPEGGILVFVTGQREVNWLVQKLRKAFPFNRRQVLKGNEAKETKDEETAGDEVDDEGVKKGHRKRRKVKVIPQIDLDDYSVPGDIEFDSEEDGDDNKDMLSSEEEEDGAMDSERGSRATTQPLWTLPLYSMLPIHKQRRVFQPPPQGCRLCIVSTNVAETSLTIPDVKYVVDSGKCKVKLYDKVTGVTGHVVHWCSKAAANQRAGRAGRTQPGHCYRLYSSAVFNDTFAEHSPPEIQQKPVDDLYLQMKCMNIDKIVNFPFPTAPNLMQLKTAEQRLKILGALDDKGNVTPLGRAISKFPVLPRYGKMLALSHQQDLLPYTICLVAALSVQEVLLEVPIVASNSAEDAKSARQRWNATRQRWAGVGQSLLLGDNMVLLKAVGAAEYAAARGGLERFCEENGLRHKAVVEIRKLRLQLTACIRDNVPEVADISVNPEMPPPTDLQAKLLRQILLAGMGDQVAKKIMPDELKEGEEKAKFKYAYRANNMEEPVFLHQGCVLRKTLPEYVVFQEIYETNKMYMRGVAAVEPEWLPIYVPHLCNLSDPLPTPEPVYRQDTGKIHCYVSGTFGPQAWPLPRVELPHPDGVAAYRWFARYLLDGVIFHKLAKYQPVLLSRPQVMVKSWSALQPRTQELLKALQNHRCCSKIDLLNIWTKQDKRYLLAEYLKWLPESAHSEVSLMWPPIP